MYIDMGCIFLGSSTDDSEMPCSANCGIYRLYRTNQLIVCPKRVYALDSYT